MGARSIMGERSIGGHNHDQRPVGSSKQPFCVEVNDGSLFAFAALWEGWKDSSGNWLKTCTILTTTPNAVASAVHDRMPVILHPESYDLWLHPGMQNVAAVTEVLKPFDARLMRCFPAPSVMRVPF